MKYLLFLAFLWKLELGLIIPLRCHFLVALPCPYWTLVVRRSQPLSLFVLISFLVDPENEPDGLTFSVFGGYTTPKQIKKLKTAHSWNVADSFSSESEDEGETPQDDETVDTCYTPFFSVKISGDFQRNLSYFDDSECHKYLYALTCEGMSVFFSKFLLFCFGVFPNSEFNSNFQVMKCMAEIL